MRYNICNKYLFVKSLILSKLNFSNISLFIFFIDINTKAPVHILIIPKGEFISFDDFVEKSTNEKVASFFKTVQKIAKDNGLSDNSYRIVGNCGEEAGQIVPHFHIHLMGYNLQTKKSE